MSIDKQTAQTYTPTEAAAILGVDRTSIYDMLRHGALPGTQISTNRWRIPRTVVDRMTTSDSPVMSVAEAVRWAETDWLFATIGLSPDKRRNKVWVVTLRFSSPPLSLEEVGHRLGVTRERVRQIEHRALRHIVNAVIFRGTVSVDLVPRSLPFLLHALLTQSLKILHAKSEDEDETYPIALGG